MIILLNLANHFEEEIIEFFTGFKNSVVGIIMDFYTKLVDTFGETPTNILLMGLGFFILIYVLLKIINR